MDIGSIGTGRATYRDTRILLDGQGGWLCCYRWHAALRCRGVFRGRFEHTIRCIVMNVQQTNASEHSGNKMARNVVFSVLVSLLLIAVPIYLYTVAVAQQGDDGLFVEAIFFWSLGAIFIFLIEIRKQGVPPLSHTLRVLDLRCRGRQV